MMSGALCLPGPNSRSHVRICDGGLVEPALRTIGGIDGRCVSGTVVDTRLEGHLHAGSRPGGVAELRGGRDSGFAIAGHSTRVAAGRSQRVGHDDGRMHPAWSMAKGTRTVPLHCMLTLGDPAFGFE